MPEPFSPQAEKPHYSGHRDRLRSRFLKGGKDALADYELLELILFMVIPRRDVKPLAKSLLQQFGNLAGVVHATPHELLSFDLSESTVTGLKAIEAVALEMMKEDVQGRSVLNSWTALTAYLRASMAHETKEHFRLLLLNKKNELIADETQQTGTVDHTPAYPREIMKRALEVGATALILVHNHPSGDATPSQPDIDMTREIIAAGKPFSIVIHDHVIVSRSGITSMKKLGLI